MRWTQLPVPGAIRRRVRGSGFVQLRLAERALRGAHPNWQGILADAPRYWRELRSPATDKPKVLLATVTGGDIRSARMESVLAAALTLRQAEVHVLLCDASMPACALCNSDLYPNEDRFAETGPVERHCSACFEPARDMFGSMGVAVHRYSDLITPDEAAEAAHLAATIDIGDVADYTVDGMAIGEHAHAGALRYFARGTLRDDETSRTVLRRYLEAAIRTRVATERLLGGAAFDVAVAHHGIYVPHGVVGEVARQRGVRVVDWTIAYRKARFIFSHGDTYHHTLMTEPTATWEQLPWSPARDDELEQYLHSRWSGTDDWVSFNRDPELALGAIATETGIDFSKPGILMLTNVMWDAQLHYPANAFPGMLDWALRTIEYFASRPDLELVIRVHPAELTGFITSKQLFVDAVAEAYPTLPPNVHVIGPESRVSTYVLAEQCNAALIYGTKTGVELAAAGIPVVVAGEAWVRNKGITEDAQSADDYVAILDRLPHPGRLPAPVVERARKYAYHFFFRRMIPLGFADDLLTTVIGFEWPFHSTDALEPGADRGLDVICDGILAGTPFVYPAEEMSVVEA